MLEQLIKTTLIMMIITLFIITCLNSIKQNNEKNTAYIKHASMINKLRTNNYTNNTGNTITCIPKLINNTARRECIES